ncbi:MAG: acetylornithine deacetylase, partial [Bacillota bacterium]
MDVVDLLQRLVRVNTVNPPGNELEGARALARWLSDHGIEAEIDEFLPGRANLTARVRGRGDGPTLMLNTHLDVVPAGDGWSRDPLAGAVENGRVYGRGAADSKGSLAAMAAALVTARDAGVIAQGELVLAAAADEESGSAGARHLSGPCRPDPGPVGPPPRLRLAPAPHGSPGPWREVRGRHPHAPQPPLGATHSG